MASNLAALRKIIKEFVKSVEDKEKYLAEFQTLVNKIEEAKEFDTLTLGRRTVEKLKKCVAYESYDLEEMDGKNYRIIGGIRYNKKNYREEADKVPFGIPTYRHLTYELNDYMYGGFVEEAYIKEIVANPSQSKIVQKITQKKNKSSYLKERTIGALYRLWVHPFIYVTQFIPKGEIILSFDYTMKPSYRAACSWWEFDKSEYDESLDKYKLSKGKFSETHPDWIKNVDEFLDLLPEHIKKLDIYWDTLKEMKSILLKSGAKPKAYMKYFLHYEENANNVKTFKAKGNKKGGRRTRKVR